MSPLSERTRETVVEVAVFVIFGLGFLDLFLGVVPGVPFYVVWVVGFAVVLPLLAILLEDDDRADEAMLDDLDRSMSRLGRDLERAADPWSARRRRETHRTVDDDGDPPLTDAVETLRSRYARGDLTDAQFERKLDRLLETESPESAAEWRSRERRRGHEPPREREFEDA
ncbi:SHOCT domain-containing protein [Halomarina ordinaria]|uniref:SHOCT domain-containing protein n=1 Tax=Halomarina ordinaria TaxID=3033939 RepID=A0ABD5UCT7_9EURY|nr:SHOCT domain-containing protein [Halomarina sp. PSRA2]